MEVAQPLGPQTGAMMTFAAGAPPTTPLQSPSLSSSPSSSPAIPRLSLRSVATLGHTLIHGDSAGIYSLLQTLAEKGKSRHEERKKRKRTKKDKQEKTTKPEKDKSASWSASSIAEAKAAEATAAAATAASTTTKKGSGIKRNRSVSAQMFASADNMTVSHRDRSRSAPQKSVNEPSCPPTPTPSPHSVGGVPRNKEAIVRSRSASSASGLLRDAAASSKKPGSAGSSPLVAHSGSSVPTAIKKTSPRHRARSSSACGTPSTSPIRRASVAPTTSSSAQAALMLSPRTERAASLPESGFCALHGRPHGHHHQHQHQAGQQQHQTRTMLTAGGHHPTCRHAREQAAQPTVIDFSSIPLVSVSAAIGEDHNHAAMMMMDAEVDALFRGGSELMATGSTSSTPSNTPRCLPGSPLASPLMSPGRRPSFDVMHIADTMQRVSIESFDDAEFKPTLPFFELAQLSSSGNAPVAQQAYSPYNGYHHSAPHHLPVQKQQPVGGLYLPPAPQFHQFAPAPQQQQQHSLPVPLSMPPSAEMSEHHATSPSLGYALPEPSLAEGEGFFTSLLRDDGQFDELCMVIDNMEATIPSDICFDHLL